MGAIIKKKSPAQHSLPTHEKTIDPQKKKKLVATQKNQPPFHCFLSPSTTLKRHSPTNYQS